MLQRFELQLLATLFDLSEISSYADDEDNERWYREREEEASHTYPPLREVSDFWLHRWYNRHNQGVSIIYAFYGLAEEMVGLLVFSRIIRSLRRSGFYLERAVEIVALSLVVLFFAAVAIVTALLTAMVVNNLHGLMAIPRTGALSDGVLVGTTALSLILLLFMSVFFFIGPVLSRLLVYSVARQDFDAEYGRRLRRNTETR